MARLRRLAQVFSAGLLVLGLALRLTVKDAIDELAVFFYATPWPVLSVLGFISGALWMGKWNRFAWGCLTVGVIAAGTWVVCNYERNPQAAEAQNLRVVSWNAEHAKKDLPAIIEKARSFDADILGITETESTEPADADRWRTPFPGHTVKTLPGYMLLITRGEILGSLSGSLAGRGDFNLMRVKFGERPVQVLFVDFAPNPIRSRRLAFDTLNSTLGNLPKEPVVVMGDFNTPRESTHIAKLQEQLQDAFAVGGHGFAETWPVPVPVLSLDHILVSKSLRVLRCAHSSSLSDHRPVVADLAWE